MNAHDTGRESGFAHFVSYRKIVKSAFQKIGEQKAKSYYKTPTKREEFLAGWMENWTEPHPTGCPCAECVSLRAIEIETY